MRRWVLAIAAGVAVAGLGVFLAVAGLDDADKWASVFGLFLAVAGLGLSAYGLVGARRPAGGQSVTDSVVGSGVTQVHGVRGNVRIGPSTSAHVTPANTPPPSGQTPPAPPSADDVLGTGGQSVTRSWTAGPARQVDGVGGDAELDR